MSDQKNEYLQAGEDGRLRCWWGAGDAEYCRYHDEEWGRPVVDDQRLFEKICLEGFQSGLSWLTILRKRENFRKAFNDFDFRAIAKFDDSKVVPRLLENAGIIRHRGKIEATLNNARRAVEMTGEFGSLAAYFWSWEPAGREPHVGKGEYDHPVPSVTDTSLAMSKDLKKRGWKFFGPTTAYAFMQAMGMVNDHLEGCIIHKESEALRAKLVRPSIK
ncbi:DNA-3-methyladenine glycosylase I [Verrucomicrobiales bacterium BCK34]|nr:DNA-3-methyladenine glycosylase I [Verrucomicrobiales bacterium BCK34]